MSSSLCSFCERALESSAHLFLLFCFLLKLFPKLVGGGVFRFLLFIRMEIV